MKWLPKSDALAAAAQTTGGCAMCSIDSEPIAANEHAIAVLDRFAARPGHVLVVLRRHAERIAQLPYPEYAALQELAWQIAGALERVIAPRRIYLAALGSEVALPTSFPHVHVHVIPLADGVDRLRPREAVPCDRLRTPSGSAARPGEAVPCDRDRPANVFTWEHGMYVFEDAAEEAALRMRLRAALAPPELRGT